MIKEEPALVHGGIQGAFSRMAEGRVTNVVYQRQSLDEVYIQSKLPCYSSRNLRHLDRMRQPVSKMVGIATGENLRFGLQPTKGTRVDHAVAITLEIITIGMWRFQVPPPTRVLHSVRSGELTHTII